MEQKVTNVPQPPTVGVENWKEGPEEKKEGLGDKEKEELEKELIKNINQKKNWRMKKRIRNKQK